MTATNYPEWVADGQPWRPAPVIAQLAAMLRGHGYTVYELGDMSHLLADPPEDHTPYSHTPWPGPQPYPLVLALDVMPGGPVMWTILGERIVSARNAGVPGTEWIKYVNYTDHYGDCWHVSWEPDYARRPSTDTGHIHISARTDRVNQSLGAWDPVTRPMGGPQPPTTTQEDRMYALPIPTPIGTAMVIPTPFSPSDNPAFSIATDTGSGGNGTTKWRVAHHNGNGSGWTVVHDQATPLVVDAQARRVDVVCPPGTDKTILTRLDGDGPASVLVWW